MSEWITSSFSYGNNCVETRFVTATDCSLGDCVEVAVAGTQVQVRDSKDPGGPVLTFSLDEWRAFLAGAAAGEFDAPEAAA